MSIEIFGHNKVENIPYIPTDANPIVDRVIDDRSIIPDYPILGSLAEISLAAIKDGFDKFEDKKGELPPELVAAIENNDNPIIDAKTLKVDQDTLFAMDAFSFPYDIHTSHFVAGVSMFRAAVAAARLFDAGVVRTNDYRGQLEDEIYDRRVAMSLPRSNVPYPPSTVAAGINGFERNPLDTKLQLTQVIPFRGNTTSRSLMLRTTANKGLVGAELTSTRHDGLFSQIDNSDSEFYQGLGTYVYKIDDAIAHNRR